VADWEPRPQHQAFGKVLNGGVIGTILDCHSNWAAAYSLMKRRKEDRVPPTVTAEYCVKLHRPTPMDRKLHLEARVTKVIGSKVTVESKLYANQRVTASFKGTFVAVDERHPAFLRWV